MCSILQQLIRPRKGQVPFVVQVGCSGSVTRFLYCIFTFWIIRPHNINLSDRFTTLEITEEAVTFCEELTVWGGVVLSNRPSSNARSAAMMGNAV
ncbi:hypothetical protein GJ744_008077 [Endocarpon pusillum]|uniref:Uncharacterized protein n=1 Tax=Endocarpon pusillum TaxID=364733 RepID=A0A8H7AJM6_9EURO|nr:hypothetical protein GJ744_008077 [Endocarpon pusillum]